MTQVFVYLAAALFAVPFANRLGLGSVLGYLLAGVAIGPFALGLVGSEDHAVMHVAEFGVVMMLFIIGLELRPSVLWQLRRTILGMGASQVLVTAAAIVPLLLVFGIDIRPAVAIGLTLSLSSTAIILQSLNEKNLLGTEGGQSSFSVLLFQDIAVIPMIAFIPLLAPATFVRPSSSASHSPVADQPAWLQGIFIVSAVVAIVLAGRYLIRPVFRYFAATRQREIFTTAALFLVVAIALLMQYVGMSAALGTFVAGLMLAESEFRHELEGDIEPFKGLLLGLFFISVGAGIDFGLLAEKPLAVVAMALGLVAIKGLVLYGLARFFKMRRAARWLFAFALAQGGEFAFVLASFATKEGVISTEQTRFLTLVVALSMLLTPLLLLALERLVLPRVAERSEEKAPDEIPAHDHSVIVVGFGRFGQIVARMLRASGYDMTILDHDAEILETAALVGMKVHYGDASRLELLAAAGCARAKILVIAIDDREKTLQIAEAARTHFPNLTIISRAWDRLHYFQLLRLGVHQIFRETFSSAVEAGTASLRALGVRAYKAHRIALAYRAHDERALLELEKVWGQDQDVYFETVRRAAEETERLLREDGKQAIDGVDEAFDNDILRPDAGPAEQTASAN